MVEAKDVGREEWEIDGRVAALYGLYNSGRR